MADDIAGDGSPGRVDEAPAGAAAFDGCVLGNTNAVADAFVTGGGSYQLTFDTAHVDTAGYFEEGVGVSIPEGKAGLFRVEATVYVEAPGNWTGLMTLELGTGLNSGTPNPSVLAGGARHDEAAVKDYLLHFAGTVLLEEGPLGLLGFIGNAGGQVHLGWGFAYCNLSLQRIGDLPA